MLDEHIKLCLLQSRRLKASPMIIRYELDFKIIYHSILSPVSARGIVSSTGPLGTRTKRPGTKHSETIRKGQKCSEGQNIFGIKRPAGQNIQGKNVWKQNICGTKHPWGQNVKREITAVGTKLKVLLANFLMSIGGKIPQTNEFDRPTWGKICENCTPQSTELYRGCLPSHSVFLSHCLIVSSDFLRFFRYVYNGLTLEAI